MKQTYLYLWYSLLKLNEIDAINLIIKNRLWLTNSFVASVYIMQIQFYKIF
jgi:hypothetical protein